MLDNVKSKYIIEEIFEKIKNKRKLNIIKYNKRMLLRLNIRGKDFGVFLILKEFNQIYHKNIEDIDIKQLNLNKAHLGNKGLKHLATINFKELITLDLRNNDISDINILDKLNLKKLNNLDLSHNEISDINILEKVNFKQLQLLNLSYNKISDINILEKVDFKQLQKLDLSNNKISDIKVLERVHFKQLEYLDLSNNKITIKNNPSIITHLNSKISKFYYDNNN